MATRRREKMTAGCGCGESVRFEGLSKAYRRVLWVVIAINASMFVVEMAAGQLAGSQALKADALDFLGDTLTYGLSLAVIGRPLVWRARAALVKGFSLAAMGVLVLASTLWQVLVLGVPSAPVMGTIGLVAFAMASLFLASALAILSQARAELAEAAARPA